MSFGPYSVFTVSAASGVSLSTYVDLQRAWRKVYLDIPTMTSNTQLFIQASDTVNGVYSRLRHPATNSTSVQTWPYAIVSSATNVVCEIPAGFRFLKIEQTAASDGGVTFKILCGG